MSVSDSYSYPPPLPVLTAPEMQAWDRAAIEVLGIPERLLMEVAGRAAARVLHEVYPRGRVAAAVGRGNNGGDALVVLRCLRSWGREVVAVPVSAGAERPELLHGWDVPVAKPDAAGMVFRDAAVVVDGILGTGSRGAPREPEAGLVHAILESGSPVVALDGPTGVDLTDGSVAGPAVRADLTITFGAPKRGLLLYPGRGLAGRVVAVEVGFPPLADDQFGAELVVPAWVRARLPRLPPNAHKGNAGSVAVVAGRPGMGGAAILCAMGALRAGAGVVRVVSAGTNRVPVQAAVPEAIFVERETGEVADALQRSDAMVLGPGMGTDEAALQMLRAALGGASAPVVLDADALTLLSREPELLSGETAGRAVLTPHPGEMARLLGRSTPEVVADPFGAAAAAAKRFGCVVLLKGSPVLVASPGARTLVSVSGHSGVATGGMGDTLCGIVGALLGAGAPTRDAAAMAIHLAGRAAEIAGRGRSLLPRDVADALSDALSEPPPRPDLPFPDVLLDLRAAR